MEGGEQQNGEREEHQQQQQVHWPAESQDAESNAQSMLEQEREKHRRRQGFRVWAAKNVGAAKFGVEYKEPEKRRDLRMEARRERFARPGFSTGFDLFTEEETAKREARAQRFQLDPEQAGGLQWQPPVPNEDEEKKKARAARFGVEYQAPDETGLMDVDLFEQRKDVALRVPRRPEAVHVYGVDLMSTKDCLSYFTDYGPTFVEWINDSSCNVLFADAATAKRAVVGLGKPLPPEDSPDLQGLDTSDPANISFLWHKGEDFIKAGSAIPLIFRIATVEDVKPSERVQSRRLWLTAAGGQQRERSQTQQQQQRGRRRRGRGGGGSRGGAWQHDDRFKEGEGGDVAMRARPRGRRTGKRRRNGDVEMVDADEQGVQDVYADSGRLKATRLDAGAGSSVEQLQRFPEREPVTYDDL